MKFFSKKRLSKGWFTGLVLGLASSAVVVYATVVDIPFPNFQTGATISADEMNKNFAAIADCPSSLSDEMVPVGSICVDKYEASIVTGGTCADPTGAGCTSYVAQSVQGVLPETAVTWAQAARACANAGKRLLSTSEWQVAAMGTDANVANCNTASGTITTTGADAVCASDFGVVDMVGNAAEWAEDWRGLGGAVTITILSDSVGVLRGADASDGAAATVEWLQGGVPLDATVVPLGGLDTGFRCAR